MVYFAQKQSWKDIAQDLAEALRELIKLDPDNGCHCTLGYTCVNCKVNDSLQNYDEQMERE